jgi:hypothetical protein
VSARRPQPGFPLFLVSVVACLVIVVFSSVTSANRQMGAVFDTYKADEGLVLTQVTTDGATHSALTNATSESSDFGASVSSLVSVLTPCIGSAATASTSGQLDQLAGFAKLHGGPRDVRPRHVATGNDSGESVDPAQMIAILDVDRAHTAQTQADILANVIARNEVNQDLYSLALDVSSGAPAFVSADHYASRAARNAYTQSVADVASAARKTAPAIKGGQSITGTESSELLSSLGNFATECEAHAASNAARTPASVTMKYLPWGEKGWPSNKFLYAIQLTVNVAGHSTPGCTSVRLISEGIATGNPAQKVTVKVPEAVPPVYKVLTHYTSATSVQWAVVGCASQ